MADLLFPGFLEDNDQYKRSEDHWQKLWKEVLQFTGKQGEWSCPWMTASREDGTPEQDGNPIFTALNERGPLGVRIIQYERESPDEIDFDFWTDIFGERTDPNAVRELVISCELTNA